MNFLARFALCSAILAFSALTAGPVVAATPQVAPNVFDQQSGTATVKSGQYFVLALPANRTTGYSWVSASFDKPGVASVVGTTYHAQGAMRPGAGGTQLFLLRAAATGTATLTVQYSRPWEKNAKPARTATLKITVNGG